MHFQYVRFKVGVVAQSIEGYLSDSSISPKNKGLEDYKKYSYSPKTKRGLRP
jgi:hypothetical protein